MELFLLPIGVIVGHALAPTAVPGISITSLGFDRSDVIFLDAVSPAKKGAVVGDFIKPCPHRWRFWILDDAYVAFELDLSDAGEFGRIKPCGASLDCDNNIGSGLINAHEQMQNIGAFGAAERR